MAPLGGLPSELLVFISNEVHPADLVNFALVCKELHTAATRALAHHRALQQQYGRVGNYIKGRRLRHHQLRGNIGNGGIRLFYLPDLLRAVLEEPRLAFYIRRLVLRDLALSWEEPCSGVLQSEPIYPQCDPDVLDRLLDVAKASRLNPWERWEGGETLCFREDAERAGGWYHELAGGSEGIIAGLLISRLTHLSTLEWQTDDTQPDPDEPQWLFEMCQRMVVPGSAHLFCNLTTVILGKEVGDDNPSYLDVGTLAWFMALPSVKTIHACGLGRQDLDENILLPNTSNVSALVLSYADSIAAEALDRIIACPRKLQAFTDIRPEDSSAPPFRMIRTSLDTLVRESLQKLTLRCRDPFTWELGTWSQYSNLKFLGTELSLFLPEVEDETKGFDLLNVDKLINTLQKRLPPSLEHIRVYEYGCLSLYLALEYMMGIIEKKGKIFPNLQRLDLCLYSENTWAHDMNGRRQIYSKVSSSCRANHIDIHIVIHKWGCLMEEFDAGFPKCEELDSS